MATGPKIQVRGENAGESFHPLTLLIRIWNVDAYIDDRPIPARQWTATAFASSSFFAMDVTGFTVCSAESGSLRSEIGNETNSIPFFAHRLDSGSSPGSAVSAASRRLTATSVRLVAQPENLAFKPISGARPGHDCE